MKLIAVLFLCSMLPLSVTQEYHSQEIDCNDEDVFKSADVALKAYNNENQSGNKFVLYRITEVTKTVSELCLTLFGICAITGSPGFTHAHTHTITKELIIKRRSLQLLEKTTLWPRTAGQGMTSPRATKVAFL